MNQQYYHASVTFTHFDFVITTNAIVCEQPTEECAVQLAKSLLNDNSVPKWMYDTHRINVEWL